jgi:uncharacterized protein YciI
MHFVVIGKDRGDGSLRAAQRAAHLDYVAGFQHLLLYGGPLIEGGKMVGSLFVFDVPDRATLDSYVAGDPYFTTPIFDTIEIYESRRMVPEQEPGLLAAEAARARG